MLGMKATQLDSYNKGTKDGQGTLVSNWFEERELRNKTGEGRSIANTHFHKKHEDLLLKPPSEVACLQNPRVQDRTEIRVLGIQANDIP